MIWIAAGGIAFAALCAFAFYDGLYVQHYAVRSEKLRAPVRLAVVADLHSTPYGKGQAKLAAAIRSEAPDAVVFVGDIVDDKRPEGPAMQLFRALRAEFPCYYVSGNHEFRSGRQEEIKAAVRSLGVTVLEGTAAALNANGETIAIAGVDDPEFWDGYDTFHRYDVPHEWRAQLAAAKEAAAGIGAFCVLLSHRPEPVEAYRGSGFDLVLSGHAHGGQVRLPGLINGLFAPCQGWFPKYAGGVYGLSDTTLIVSRGLSRNAVPRVFNRRELVIVAIGPEAQYNHRKRNG